MAEKENEGKKDLVMEKGRALSGGVGSSPPPAKPMTAAAVAPPRSMTTATVGTRPVATALGGTRTGLGTTKEPKFEKPEFNGERKDSIIPVDVRGLLIAAGLYGAGKTSLLAGIDRPENVLFVDFEHKGDGITNQLGIENYFCPPREVAIKGGMDYDAAEVMERAVQVLQAAPRGRFTTVVLDGITTLQQALLDEVESDPGKYNVKEKNIAGGAMGGAWPGVSLLFNRILGVIRSKDVMVIGVSAAAEQEWGAQGPIPNKFGVKGPKELSKQSILTIALIPSGEASQMAPAGLVLKQQLGKYRWNEDAVPRPRMEVVPRLPLRLPEASMDAVYGYLENPVDMKNPKKGEVPSKEELEMYSKTFSKEQMSFYKEYLKAARMGPVGEELKDG